jgi:hypothetical protein
MDHLAAAGFGPFKISVVVTRHNVDQLDDFKTLADSYGAQLRSAGVAQNLSRVGWTLAASSSAPDSPLANLTDGDLSTRWSSGTGQAPGMWLSVDLGVAQQFNQIVMDAGTSPGDYIRAYQVETSPDGLTWTAIAHGQGSTGEMVIPLPPTTTRHLRIVSEASSGSWLALKLTGTSESYAAMTPLGFDRVDVPRFDMHTIVALRGKLDGIRRVELERALVALRKLEPDERRALEAMTQAIVNKILHPPLSVLKQLSLQDSAEAGDVAELVHRLFALEPDDAGEAADGDDER